MTPPLADKPAEMPVATVPFAGAEGAAAAAAYPRAAGGTPGPLLARGATGSWTDFLVWGNPVSSWLVFFGVLLAVYLIVWVLKASVARKLEVISKRTVSRLDDLLLDLIKSLSKPLLFLGSLYVATRVLTLPHSVNRAIEIIAVCALALQLLITSRRVADFILDAMLRRATHADGRTDETIASSMGVFRVIVYTVVSAIILLLALDNLGVQVTPLITGLGIGGIAVALAAQNVLGDLFGSVSILLDKPFVVGDSITIGDKGGTVERIGIKTTRLRTPQGEELVCANSDLLTSRIHNFKRMSERRVALTIGVVYTTAAPLLRQIPELIAGIIAQQEQLRFDRCHLVKLNAYSLDFELVYFVKTSDYMAHVDSQQRVLLGVIELFAQMHIDFALPTQVTLGPQGAPPEASAPPAPAKIPGPGPNVSGGGRAPDSLSSSHAAPRRTGI